MQAHRIIEDLLLADGTYPGLVPDDALIKMAKIIRSSHKFYFGDGLNVFSMFKPLLGRPFFEDYEDLIFPYDTFLFEYRMTVQATGKIVNHAVLVITDMARLPDFFELFSFFKSKDSTRGQWMLEPLCIQFMIGEYFKGENSNARFKEIWVPEKDFYDPMEYYKKAYEPKILFLVCALRLLNCHDVSTKTISPAARLQKARKRRGKQRLFKYKTLVISPSRQATASEENKGLWKNRLHFVRAHKKHYTAERPLFGKVTGDIICPAHVRGNKKLGIVMKDYEVQAGGKAYHD